MKQPELSTSSINRIFSRFFILTFLGLFSSVLHPLYATHNLAGQITLEQNDPNNPNSYLITLTTYTDPSTANVDRCSADIEIWAVTGTPGRPGNPGNPIYTFITELLEIPRANGPLAQAPLMDCTIQNPRNGEEVKGPVKRNIYYATYIFPGPGLYELRYADKNRRTDIININLGKSEELAFYVETRLFITPPIVGSNNTPIILNEPLDDACSGKLWTHNPGGFDPDGDSLVYYIRPSFQYDPPNIPLAIPVTNYLFPDDPQFEFSGTNHSFTMDSITGLISWNVPDLVGIYNFAYVVEEWRDGIFLGYVIRDMAVWVKDCNNNPPVIQSINDTCVYAGDEVNIKFWAWDPDDNDSLYLDLNNGPFGNNGPFSVDNPATLSGQIVDPINPANNRPFNRLPDSTLNAGPPPDTIKGAINWNTNCDNIRKQFYQIDFYATDNKSYSINSAPGLTTLSANKVVTITVIPPPPLNLQIVKASRALNLSWEPTGCPDMVVGYNIYRKVEGGDWMQDTICCEMTPIDAGFELIGFNDGFSATSFVDSLTDINGILGKEICYAVTALYDDQNNPGIPVMESCAAGPECAEIINEILYLTNDSVSVTDPASGEIFVSWSQPSIDEFFPADYTYRLYRANNNAFPAIQIATLGYDDTTYMDTGLDTETRGYNYRVEIFDALGLRINTSENTHIGSSIFLTTTGGNNVVELEWAEYVPWQNSSYEVHRSDNGLAGPFLPIATVPGTGANMHSYTDTGLNPNQEYCYFIRSMGSHNVPDIKPLLINDSQKDCAFARDDEPPCPPGILAVGECEDFSHRVTITKSLLDCANDTDSIKVLFGSGIAGPFEVVLALDYESFGPDTTVQFNFQFDDPNLAGCYSAIAIDTLGNVSDPAEASCIDFCPALIMSNVFTPNQDGINDIFTPKFYRDVILKELKIFDRWGRLLHTSTGEIGELWDGRVTFGGKQASEGVYYYYIRYEELRIQGNTPRELNGWVTLMR